jgi:hypothetical protein
MKENISYFVPKFRFFSNFLEIFNFDVVIVGNQIKKIELGGQDRFSGY